MGRGLAVTRVATFVLAACGLALSACGARAEELADYVNTLQGTNSRFELSHGNTFPAVARPNGMHMWTPQTGHNGDGWKYQYEKSTIRGFQQAHQCSSWSNDYAVYSLMPVVGELVTGESDRAVAFRHEDELARPHHYRVKLASGVVTEMAPTVRGACLRFTFPSDKPGYLVLDGYTGASEVELQPERGRIVGWVKNGRNLPRHFRAHFVIDVGRPIDDYGVWRHGGREPQRGETSGRGRGVGAFLRVAPGETLTVRTATSYISPEQAETTLAREAGQYKDFDEAVAAAKASWNRHLGAIELDADDDDNNAQKRTFYSCLFRASLFPRKFYERDAEGEPHYFSPYDGEVHAGYMFTDTGLWDTFRGQMPLNALLRPRMHGRYLQAMLDAYDQCGWLPSWSFPGEAGSMIGNHAISVLADGWAKGIRTFDARHALDAYHHEANAKGPWGPANGRDGHRDYENLGYVPWPEVREGTAKTLEYAYDDFCGAQLAKATGHADYDREFAASMFNYRNVFDASTGFMRGKNRAGDWREPFDPIEWGGPYTEGCAWHWTWSVFHDVAGLIELLGGDEAFLAKLDAVWTQPGEYHVGSYGAPIHEMREVEQSGMGQYAHINQPMQHMPYLYCFAGQPWKTQQHVRDVMARLYDASENGYPGDEDQGQTSSWYVLSALGFYSVCPGVDEYVLGSPICKRATIHLENGRTFVVEALNNDSENVYIESARLNGEPLSRNFLSHADVSNGGQLTLEMSATPNTTRGTALADRPFSVSTTGDATAAAPVNEIDEGDSDSQTSAPPAN